MCTQFAKCAVGGVLLLVAVTLLVAVILLGATATIALAATPSELLEKAIYAEETVGDLDEAIKLYEQVIAEGRAGERAAAKAQYRLAQVYLKQGKQDEATAAFRKLIEDYPNEQELIAEAEKHLPSKLELLPAPWTEGERLQLDMKLPTGVDIGTMIYMIESADHQGQDLWRCSTRGLVTINDASSYSTVLCEKESFAPIRSRWKHSLIGEAEAAYKADAAEITVVGKKEPITLEYKPPVFDNEQCVELFRRLPLAADYKVTIPIITSLGANKIEIPVHVAQKETLTVPAGTFECYKLELGLVGQTFWVSTDEHRYIVRFAAGGVTADLVKIDQVEPEKVEKVSGKGYSFSLPRGWLTYQPTGPTKKPAEVALFLLDPEAESETKVEIRPLRSLKKEQQASPKAWTVSALDDFKSVYADFSVREPGVQDIEVGGQSAARMVADYRNSHGKKTTIVGVAVFGKDSAAMLRMTSQANKFDELVKDFDTIVESFRLE
jgi:hypothetical protein